MAEFQKALSLLLPKEGKFSNDPNDKGGPTKFGITQRTLSAWRKKECSAFDVENLTLDEASDIYRTNFWAPIKGDSINSGKLAAMFFCDAVNRGVGRTIEAVQQSLSLPVTHTMDALTVAGCNQNDENDLAEIFIHTVELFYMTIVADHADQAEYLKGWLNRAESYADL